MTATWLAIIWAVVFGLLLSAATWTWRKLDPLRTLYYRRLAARERRKRTQRAIKRIAGYLADGAINGWPEPWGETYDQPCVDLSLWFEGWDHMPGVAARLRAGRAERDSGELAEKIRRLGEENQGLEEWVRQLGQHAPRRGTHERLAQFAVDSPNAAATSGADVPLRSS